MDEPPGFILICSKDSFERNERDTRYNQGANIMDSEKEAELWLERAERGYNGIHLIVPVFVGG
jgi:hypothetical protein